MTRHHGPVRLANRVLLAIALLGGFMLLGRSLLHADFVLSIFALALLIVTVNSAGRWNDAEFTPPSRRESVVSKWVFGIAALLMLSVQVQSFLDSDRCLDQGGRWNTASKICEK